MGKFDALFEDEDDIFAGSPRSKYWDIYNQVSGDLAQDEFDKIMQRMAAMECLLMKNIDEEMINRTVDQYAFENPSEVEERKKSLYMELAGDLLYRVSD